MRKHPFLIFALVVGCLTLGLVFFIQSPHFATIFKRVAARYLPADLGIEGDFSEFAVGLFPPSLSVRRPRVVLRDRNVVGLPGGSTIAAERMDLVFRPFQMFSRDIRVHEVIIVHGDVQLAFNKDFSARPARKSKGMALRWEELLKIKADGVSLEDTRVRLRLAEPEISADFVAKSLSLSQWSGKGGVGYEVDLVFGEVSASFPKSWKIPGAFDSVRAKARITPSGLIVEQLLISRLGLEARLSGSIKGNLLEPKGLMAEVDASVKGEFGRLFQPLFGSPVPDPKLLPTGGVLFSGKVRANLDAPLETLHADGKLVLENPRYKSWGADSLIAEGSWASAPGNGNNVGELSITKAVLTARETQREGSSKPGWGGKVEAGPFKMRLGSHEPITVPLNFERAHIHWLASPAMQDIYGLLFRVSGPAKVTFVPGWNVIADVDLRVADFQLDNQRFGKNKPLRRVLKVPEIRLDGRFTVDPTGVRPEGMHVALRNTEFKVDGKVDFKTGYDLYARGEADLSDIGQIAENDIRGEGDLAVHVHGPSARTFVDFDADLKNAYYLKLALGDLKGRVTWDDDPSHLIFGKVEVTQGRTSYFGSGMFDLGDAETVRLDFDVPHGTVQDFVRIFDEQTKDLWWFPRSLDGEISGKVTVSGGISMDRLVVASEMKGVGWEYLGERFRSIALTGGYDKGTYAITSLRAVKRTGGFSGRISLDPQHRFDWELRTENLSVSDLDRLARLDVPIRGKLIALSSGRGKEGAIDSITRLALSDFRVRGVSMAPSEVVLKSSGGTATLTGSAFGGQGLLDLSYDFKPGGASYLRGACRNLDFSPVLLMLNPRLIQDRALAGTVSGSIDLAFRSGEVELGSGKIELNEYLLEKTGARFRLGHPVAAKIDHGTFDLGDLTIDGPNGKVRGVLHSRAAALDGAITGDVDMSLVEFVTSSVSQADGTAKPDISLGGTLKEPKIFGKITFNNGVVRVPSVESPFENITGSIQLRQNVLTVQNLEGDLAYGRVHAGGTILLFADRYPQVDLVGNLTGNKLRIYPFQFVKARGRITVRGDKIPYLVEGNIVVDSALTKEKISGQGGGRAFKSALYAPPVGTTDEADFPKFQLAIDVTADQGILVQNDLMDAELKGKIRVVNTIDTPRLLGTGELIQGRLIFKDRVFQVESANVEFDNPAVINPQFNMTASTDVSGTKIRLFIAGRMDKYTVELSSQPSMPQSEILSLLTLGYTTDEMKKLKTSDRGAFEQSEAASLVLHSLDFNRDVENKTGLQIQIDEAVDAQAGSSIFRPRNEGDTAVAPKIVIRRNIGKRLDLSVGSTVGVGASHQKEVNAEIHITPGISVIGVWDTRDAVDAQNNPTSSGSYGVDLKLQKRFK